MRSLTKIGHRPTSNILVNILLYKVRSKALDMSVAQVNTSLPFVMKWPRDMRVDDKAFEDKSKMVIEGVTTISEAI